MVHLTLELNDLAEVMAGLQSANLSFSERYPGLKVARQPIHTLYGGAHLFKKGTPEKLGLLARAHLARYAADYVAFAQALEFAGADKLTHAPEDSGELDPFSDAWIAREVFNRVNTKLDSEAIEDQRLDFEDGYGVRADEEEDAHAIAAAKAMAEANEQGLLPPFTGIRIKALTEEAKVRSIRTLDLFLTSYAAENKGPLPSPFYVTLPKVTHATQVAALVSCIEMLEQKCGLPGGAIKVEIMIETIQSIVNPGGECGIPALIDAGKGRVSSAILGTFDYTASANIASHHQDHRHPSADFARQMMQVCLTGTAVNICDGITNIMPIPPHISPEKGASLTDEQLSENKEVVHSAWREHFVNIQHSLMLGFYQGWDLNPAQLPIRYAAVYYFFLKGLADARARLTRFIDQAAQASMVGNTFDDAASAQGLLNFFASGISCGAFTEDEVLGTGITMEELHGRSFQAIVENRLKTSR
jgi:citrate lyase beta subunit